MLKSILFLSALLIVSSCASTKRYVIKSQCEVLGDELLDCPISAIVK